MRNRPEVVAEVSVYYLVTARQQAFGDGVECLVGVAAGPVTEAAFVEVSLEDRRQQQSFRNAWSMRNQLFFLVKHVPLQAWKSFPRIFFQEGGRVCYALIFEPDTRKLLIRALLTLQKMRKKRKEIFKNTRISSDELCAYAKR